MFVGQYMLVRRIGDGVGKDVCLEEIIVGILCLQGDFTRREFLERFYVLIDFVVKAALELGALSCEFLRIERDVLKTCGTG